MEGLQMLLRCLSIALQLKLKAPHGKRLNEMFISVIDYKYFPSYSETDTNERRLRRVVLSHIRTK